MILIYEVRAWYSDFYGCSDFSNMGLFTDRTTAYDYREKLIEEDKLKPLHKRVDKYDVEIVKLYGPREFPEPEQKEEPKPFVSKETAPVLVAADLPMKVEPEDLDWEVPF